MNLLPYLENGFSYPDYLKKIEEQLHDIENSGDEKGYAKYYSINLKRIERLDKTFDLTDEQKERLNKFNSDFKLLVISEGWCGDAAQVMPVVNVMMNEIGVEQKIVLRDENPELMNEFLTDGAKSIPILIGVNNEGNEIFRFGPRPQHGMELLKKHKENPQEYTDEQFHQDLQVWYNRDKGVGIFEEFLSKMN
ncbi:thioredoxin family protein [Moheibacter sediminis]|uniref:Thioredoxin n=1 Tax=Moheibacter sediminis TaxID=1434700 RepID=A0A1W1Z3R8_9FLAO|nr:thioredoxin family protein [Moheibacter sediminis]SMC42608.1 Thioredoxin [Moheibacter sediminis]